MYFVYIIHSKSADRYYIGYCSDMDARISKHNAGATPSTKPYRPWELVYYEKFDSKTEAIKKERKIKSMKSREYIQRLIQNSSN